MKTFAVLVALLLAAAAGAAALVYSGWYNVAATEPHLGVTRAFMTAVMSQSVRARAPQAAPPDLASAAVIRKGARHYQENCVVCHGAPGKEMGDIGKGLTPRPPDLAESAKNWTAGELYWIVKHGIRMTGMPAWGASHKDEDLWAIAAFLVRMPDVSASEYQALQAEAGKAQAR